VDEVCDQRDPGGEVGAQIARRVEAQPQAELGGKVATPLALPLVVAPEQRRCSEHGFG
jgi:hypothetical protein